LTSPGTWRSPLRLNKTAEQRDARSPRAQIRRASPEDASAIASVMRASFAEYESAYTSEAFAATISTPDGIRRRIEEGPVWVALRDKAIVGTVSVVPRGESLYIRGMAVDPKAREAGIGRALLNCAEQFAVQGGFKCLILSTTPFLSRAIRLYERYGFHRSDEGPQDLLGTPLFTMVKTLLS
jgi:ribosomal protein S18 acetylase RimI-like enzyme